MLPAEVRPRGIFTAARSGWRAAISGRWRAMLAESGMNRFYTKNAKGAKKDGKQPGLC